MAERMNGAGPTRHDKGRLGEDLAAAFLEERGMRILTRNFRCPIGEIDLVGQDGETLVFVEVKYRGTKGFGLPQESVSASKQKRLTRLAQWYMKARGRERQSARFDVVAITVESGEPRISWITNAFEARE